MVEPTEKSAQEEDKKEGHGQDEMKYLPMGKPYSKDEIEKYPGEFDEYGFYHCADETFFDNYGYWFDKDGYDEYGGYYNQDDPENWYYVPGD